MEIAIMIEGQDGMNWPTWQRFARAVEDAGFVGLYRSDHFTNPKPPDHDSLEAWVSLTWLAGHTHRIEFGPMVSPLSFRHPVWLARTALAIDDLSNGRLYLGVGAGWQEREHKAYGFDLLDVDGRFKRFTEGLEVIHLLLHSDQPVSFKGEFYQLEDALLLPRPQRPGGPPILIGGNGEKRTLPLVAKYAKEWNGVFIPASRYAELNKKLDELLVQHNRKPGDVKRSLMTAITFGRDDAELTTRLQGRAPEDLRKYGIVVGTPSAVVDQLHEHAEAGVQRIMLNWGDFEDIDGLAALAKAVL